MRIIGLCSALLFIFLLGGCEQAAKEVAIKPAANAAAAVTDYFLIDVRSQEEWDEGHLENAIHIPHTEIGDGIAKVTDNKDAKIFLY